MSTGLLLKGVQVCDACFMVVVGMCVLVCARADAQVPSAGEGKTVGSVMCVRLCLSLRNVSG